MTWGQAIRVFWYFWAILVIVLVLAVVGHAEWMQVQRLGGLVTRTELGVGSMENARLIDGWQVRAGGLYHPWYKKHATDPVLSVPTYLLGHSVSGNSLLFYADNFYRLRNDTCALVGKRLSSRPDTGQAVNGTDSILTNWENLNFPCVEFDTGDGGAVHRGDRNWLSFALTDRASVNWNGASVAVNNFYSNRFLLANQALTVQIKPMANPISSPSINEGSGTVDYDTTLIFDGTYIWKYEGYLDSIRNVNTTTVSGPPVFQRDTGVTSHYYDTLRVLNTFELGAGDTVLAIRVNTDDSLRGGDYRRFWVLLDDTLSTTQCVPCSVMAADTTLPDSVLLTLGCDSTRFANVNHYWGRVEGSGSPCMYAILYRPGERTDVTPVSWAMYDTTSGSPRCWPPTYSSAFAPLVRVTHLGHWGLLHYAKIEMVAGTTHLPFTSALMGKKARVTDCDIFELVTDGAGASNPDTLQIICTAYSANTKQGHGAGSCTPGGTAWPHYFTFLAFSKDTIKPSDFVMTTPVSMQAHNRPRVSGWSEVTVSATTSNDRFAVLGKQRCWTSGNTHVSPTRGTRDSSLWVRYTNIVGTQPNQGAGGGDYATFPSANKLLFQGFDPVTGLSVSDQTVRCYMARSINIVTGFVTANFGTQKVVEGLGSVNHWVIAPTRTGADALCNDNGAFLFNGGGLEPLSDAIVEVFTDSINWDAGSKLRGAVWDNMYFVTAPFDTFTSCRAIVGFDLETGDSWLSRYPAAASVWNFRAIDGSERLFYGDRDSSVIWQEGGASNDLYFVSDWRSMWSDLGDGARVKGVQSYRVDWNAGASGDSLIVDWYVDFADSPVWSDTVIAASAGYQSDPSSVPLRVAGRYLSFGLRSADSAMNPVGFGFEYNDRGRGRK